MLFSKDAFTPQEPSQLPLDATRAITRVKYQNMSSGMKSQWLTPSSISPASKQAVSLLTWFGRHTGNYPPASFTVILLRSFLVRFAGTHTGDFHGRGVLGDALVFILWGALSAPWHMASSLLVFRRARIPHLSVSVINSPVAIFLFSAKRNCCKGLFNNLVVRCRGKGRGL